MNKFKHVEDYIEVINGDRNPTTGVPYGVFDGTDVIISLARYDVKVINSMSQSTLAGVGLTDRQAELAVKIILKYQRQLESVNIDVSPVNTPIFRIPLRFVDRSESLTLNQETNKLELKFPYNTTHIDTIRSLAKQSAGQWAFNIDRKVWVIALTELNLIAAYTFASLNKFAIDPEVKRLVDMVEQVESTPYAIQLVKHGEGYTIENAEQSLIDYVENECGGFTSDNLLRLVDVAPMLGFVVPETLLYSVIDHSKSNWKQTRELLSKLRVTFPPSFDEESVSSVIEYARMTNRYPIYVYEPDMSRNAYTALVAPYFSENEVLTVETLNKSVDWADSEQPKVVYFTKFGSEWSRPIPLLISTHGMMYGAGRILMLQKAKKVVYFVTEVYNNNTSRRDT